MANKVIIYSTPGCVYCQMAKEFFRQNNVVYEEKNVAIDEKAREEMVEKSSQLGVPVIDIDGKIVTGFDKDKINEFLKIR